MHTTPAITIVLPVYNGQRYLSEALEATLAQTFADFELVIVDDCSTDATPSILARYAACDARIRIIRNEMNLKLPATLNVGHRAGRGRLFTWTSDDNNPHPDWLQALITSLENNKADIVYSRYQGIDEAGRAIISSGEWPPLSQLLWHNTVGASFLYTRSVFEILQGYDKTLFLLEDYDFWVRAYLHGFVFVKLDACLYDYRRHAAALSCSIPQDELSIYYRVRIRKLFKKASPDEIFKSRTTFIYNGKHILPKFTLFILFLEALAACPSRTIATIWARGREFICRT